MMQPSPSFLNILSQLNKPRMKTWLKNSFLVVAEPDDIVNASSNGSRLEDELNDLFEKKRISRTEYSVLVTRVRSMSAVIDHIGQQTVPDDNPMESFFN